MVGLSIALFAMDQRSATLQGFLAAPDTEKAAILRAHYKPEDLKLGANPWREGDAVLFAVEGSGAQLTFDHGDRQPMLEAGGVSYFWQKFEAPTGAVVRYYVGGQATDRPVNFEFFPANPLVQLPPGGMRGSFRDMGELKSAVFPGTVRKWYVYLPPNIEADRDYPVLFATDAQWDRQWIANGLENAARGGLIPPTVGVFIEPGQDKPGNYSNRSREYDTLSDAYTRFLLEEIEPEVAKLAKLSQDPSKRACIGMSSGGICAFTACWQRPDKFGVAISAVGSFTNLARGESGLAGGHNYPPLIRMSDKKPIRIFLQDGSHDLDNQFGNWFLANQEMAAALRFKDYDYQWHPGPGFHSTEHLRSIFDEALKFAFGG
ncbi:MAG: enterochelin esterase [Armatimonadetes bacterium]|nr:enterochelin esterase [Armatimonadota bacterium]